MTAKKLFRFLYFVEIQMKLLAQDFISNQYGKQVTTAREMELNFMTFKQGFVLLTAILLSIAAAGCGGSSTNEAQVEAAESEEMMVAPLDFSEPPETSPSETAEPSTMEPRAEQSSANVAPTPPKAQPAPTRPPQPAAGNRIAQPDDPVSSPTPVDRADRGQVTANQQSQIVVPPSAPRTVADAPAYRDASPPPQPRYVRIPEGTVVEIRLEERVASDEQRTGDRFKARLDRDIEVDGEVVFPVGTEVTGKILDATESGRVEGRARMELALESLKRGEESFPIRTNPIAVEAEGSKGRDAKIIGGAAAVGALIGAITGGKKGAAVGAASGAGAGTAGVLITKGEEVDLPRERLLSFRLEDSFEAQVK